MDWWIVLIILLGGFVAIMATGLPVAFCFGILNTAAILLFFHGGIDALNVIATGAYDSVSSFVFVAVPLFLLMGSVLTHTGVASLTISAIDIWIGRVPGRLGVVAEAAGVIFGAASGSSMASTATIGQVLIPEMLKRGYAPWLAMGSVACTGGIDMLIPPSALMVIFAGIASMPVGPLLIAGIIPGILIAVFLCIFIIIAAKLKPEIAPPMEERVITFRDRVASLKYILPVAVLILAVMGAIFFGVATPSESAALGAFASFVIAAAFGRLTLESIRKALFSTVSVTGMTLLIITTSKVFSQILAYTGITTGLVNATTALTVGPLTVLFAMVIVVLFLGCFIDQVSIMLITIPIFLPIANAMHMNILWWAIIMNVNLGLSLITPPFGMNLFVVRAVTPGNPDLMEVYRAVLPFIVIEFLGMTMMILFPGLVTWLPGLMY